MALYRYDGNLYRSDSTEIIEVVDSFGLTKFVARGQTVDLTPATYTWLSQWFLLNTTSTPIPGPNLGYSSPTYFTGTPSDGDSLVWDADTSYWTPSHVGGGGGGSFKLGLIVAANDASAPEKAAADYLCDGTNDEVQVQAAVDASPSGGAIYLTGGTFNFSRLTSDAQQAHVQSTKPLQIRGAGMHRTMINRTTYLAGFIFTGSRGSNVNLTVNAVQNDWTLTLTSTSGLAADGYLRLKSDDQPPATNVNGRRGEIVRIKSVDSGTVVSLYGPLEDAYPTASNAVVAPITFLESPSMRDMGFTQASAMAPENSRGNVRYMWCRAGRFTNIYAEYGDAFALDVYANIDTVADGLSMWDFYVTSTIAGYGVVARGPSRDCFVVNSYMRKGRNLFTTGSESDGMPSNWLVANCQATEMTAPAFAVHADSRLTTFSNCRAINTRAYGFFIQDEYTRLINCTVDGAVGSGIFLNYTAVAPTIIGGVIKNVIASSVIGTNADNNGGGTGINVGVGSPRVNMGAHIDGLIIQDCQGPGINVYAHDNYIRAYVRNTETSAASFRQGVQVLASSTGNHLDIHAEDISTASGYGIFFADAGAFQNNTLVRLTTRNCTHDSNYAAATNPTFINVKDYDAKGDFKTITDASITGTALGSTSQAQFTVLDVGKAIHIAGAGVAAAPLVTTIASVTNTTTAVVTDAASTVVASAGTAAYGTNDRAAIAAALLAAAPGGTLYFPKGGYYADVSSASALPLTNNLVLRGDGWGSYIKFGPELTTATQTGIGFGANVNVTLENLRLVGPTSIGSGGSMWAFNMGGATSSLKLRNVNIRLMTNSVYASGAGAVVDLDDGCEIEGRGGGDPTRAVLHDGTSGKVHVNNAYIWNCGSTASQVHAIQATTGIDTTVNDVVFDTHFGTGYCVFHFDTLGSAPTANKRSSVTNCVFGTGIPATAVRTPYQGSSIVHGNTFNGTGPFVQVTGKAAVTGNQINSTQTAATNALINLLNVTTPLTVRPSARVLNNTFTGRALYAIYLNSDGDLTAHGNEFLCGDATVAVTGQIRGDSSAGASSRVDIRNNIFGGQSGNYSVQAGPGIYDVVGNRFVGVNSSACIASQGGTPTRLTVDQNDISPTSGGAVTLTTTPTTFQARGNYGSTGYVTKNAGTSSVANGATIAHGLTTTPTFYQLTPTVAGRQVSVTAVSTTTLTVSLTDSTGTAIAVAENVLWYAECRQ